MRVEPRWGRALLGRAQLLAVAVALLVAAPVLILGQASEDETHARLRAAQLDSAVRAAEVASANFSDRETLIRATLASLALGPDPDESPIGLAAQTGDVAALQAFADAVQRLYPRYVRRTYIALRGHADTILEATIVAAAPPATGLVGQRLTDLGGASGAAVREWVANLGTLQTGALSDAFSGSAEAPSGQVVVVTIAPSPTRAYNAPRLSSASLATVVAELDFARTFADAVTSSLAPGDDAYLFDDKRRLIGRARGPTPFPLLDLSGDPFIQLIGPATPIVARAGIADPLGAGTRLIATTTISGVNATVAGVTLSSSFLLLLVRDTSGLDREVDAALGQLALFRLAVVGMLLVLAYLAGLFAAALRRRQQDLMSANARLDAASEAKSRILAAVSHDLRTPLNAILGFSDVLLQRLFGELNPKQEEYLRDIHGAGEHQLTLVNDLLDLSKIEAGKMELHPVPFSMRELIESAITIVRPLAEAKGVRLEASFATGVGTVEQDPMRFKQVLLNLLSNAIKFTSTGGSVRVDVSATDGRVSVAVCDTGVGISPEDQAVVFEEFRQVGASGRSSQGTGLGLALVRGFVRMMGGEVSLRSAVGEGSAFTVVIPLRQAASV